MQKTGGATFAQLSQQTEASLSKLISDLSLHIYQKPELYGITYADLSDKSHEWVEHLISHSISHSSLKFYCLFTPGEGFKELCKFSIHGLRRITSPKAIEYLELGYGLGEVCQKVGADVPPNLDPEVKTLKAKLLDSPNAAEIYAIDSRYRITREILAKESLDVVRALTSKQAKKFIGTYHISPKGLLHCVDKHEQGVNKAERILQLTSPAAIACFSRDNDYVPLRETKELSWAEIAELVSEESLAFYKDKWTWKARLEALRSARVSKPEGEATEEFNYSTEETEELISSQEAVDRRGEKRDREGEIEDARQLIADAEESGAARSSAQSAALAAARALVDSTPEDEGLADEPSAKVARTGAAARMLQSVGESADVPAASAASVAAIATKLSTVPQVVLPVPAVVPLPCGVSVDEAQQQQQGRER